MTGYRCEHILHNIDHSIEDYYVMLTTADGKEGRLATGNVTKMKKWIRQFEGCTAVVFIRTRADGWKPVKMQGVFTGRNGQCRNLTRVLYSDHVHYEDKIAWMVMFDGQHHKKNTEAWL